ncbi:MAG: GAF domain-containing protein, partial [Verrucomicrobiae bacterium]|nr:GAF domain-containing protein [Verrucomicrobiae bacterium]
MPTVETHERSVDASNRSEEEPDTAVEPSNLSSSSNSNSNSSRSSRPTRNALKVTGRYLLAVALACLALGATFLLRTVVSQSIFAFFIMAVVATTWLAGWGPGLLCTALSVLFADYYFLEPIHAFSLHPTSVGRLAVFLSIIGFIQLIYLRVDRTQYMLRRTLRQAQRTQRKNQEMDAQLRRHTDRLRAIAEASRVYAEASLDVKIVLEAVTRHASEIIRDGCIISLIQEKDGRLQPVALHHANAEALRRLQPLLSSRGRPTGEGLAGRVVQSGKSVLMPELSEEDRQIWSAEEAAGYEAGSPVHSVLVAPLRVQGRAIGSMTLFRDETPDPFRPNDQLFLQELADRAALAVEHAGLYEQSRREVGERKRIEEELKTRVEQLETVYRMTAAVSQATNLEDIYNEAINGLQRLLKADRASILICDSEGVMRFKAWRGLSEAYRKAVEGHSPWAPEDTAPKAVLIPDVQTDPAMAPYRETILSEGIRALGFIPLVAHGRLLGKFMIYYNGPHAFTDPEMRLAENIATHIALAIERRTSEAELVATNERFRLGTEAMNG